MLPPNPLKPQLVTNVPGPLAKKLVERDTRALVTTTKTNPIAAKRALGVWVEDVDGNTLLDFTSGIGVVNTGFSNPRVVRAIQEQAANLVHFAGTDFYYEQQVTLAERLGEVVPGRFAKKVFFTNSGAESNEAALKITRYHTKRGQWLGFYGAFHGRTMGALSITSSKIVQRKGFFPTTPGVHHTFYPNPYRNTWGIDGYAEPQELVNRCLDHIENTLFQHTLPKEELAAIFCEPVQGEGGYIVPPKQWFPAVRKLCDSVGALMVADEVQSGFGRTGKMFAMEHFGVAADVVSLAKGIASGIPMGASVVRADLDFDVQGAHSNTFGGNVLASAAALATLDALTLDGLVANSAKQGDHLAKRLRELQGKFTKIGDVRGLGLMQATEFVEDVRTKKPAPQLRDRVVEESMKRGLILLPCGKSSLRYIPPLSITQAEVDAGVDILAEAMRAAGA